MLWSKQNLLYQWENFFTVLQSGIFRLYWEPCGRYCLWGVSDLASVRPNNPYTGRSDRCHNVCGNAPGHAGPTWTCTAPGYRSWICAAGYALADRKKEITLLTCQDRLYGFLFVTLIKRHHGTGGRQSPSTQRNCTLHAVAVYQGSVRCSTAARFPASEWT